MKKFIGKNVRVAINNNFNCTEKEYQQLKSFEDKYPNDNFFVNCNIKTSKLLSINDHKYKVVITINPDIKVNKKLVEKFLKVDKKKIAFVRVKYIPNDENIKGLIKDLSKKGYTVVITIMRFVSKKTVNEHAKKEWYDFSCSRYRLNQKYFDEIVNYADSLKNVHICDRKGLGCQGCNLCSILTINKDVEPYCLNLSTSGLCPFNCIDCYAKGMQTLLKKWGKKSLIRYDVIYQNMKQKGNTKHIKENKS